MAAVGSTAYPFASQVMDLVRSLLNDIDFPFTTNIITPTGASRAGNLVTITTTAAHGLTVGQRVTVANSGEAGWRSLTAPGVAYDVVTLDLKMPDLSGQRLWERMVASATPFTERVVFVTGDTVEPETQRFLKSAGRPVLDKPFAPIALAAMLAEELGPA